MRKNSDYFTPHTYDDGEPGFLLSTKGVLLFTFSTYQTEQEEAPKIKSEKCIREIVQIHKERGRKISASELLMKIRTSDKNALYDLADDLSTGLTANDIQRILKG